MKLEKILTSLFPYELTLIAAFFLLPLLAVYSPEERIVPLLLFNLLIVNPGASFVTAMLYSVKHGFHWSFPIMVAILFMLACFIFFGLSGFIYLPIYVVSALIGSYIGNLFKKRSDEMWL